MVHNATMPLVKERQKMESNQIIHDVVRSGSENLNRLDKCNTGFFAEA
jgi:hypothetical protein